MERTFQLRDYAKDVSWIEQQFSNIFKHFYDMKQFKKLLFSSTWNLKKH